MNMAFSSGSSSSAMSASSLAQMGMTWLPSASASCFTCQIVAAALGVVDLIFCQIGGIDGLFQGQQVGGGDQGRVVLAAVEGTGQLALVQMVQQVRKHLRFLEELLVAALGGLLALSMRRSTISMSAMTSSRLMMSMSRRGSVDALHMGDIGVLKAPDHVDDGIGRADVAQELVAQALALGGALYQAGDIHELDDSGGNLLGLIQTRAASSSRSSGTDTTPTLGSMVQNA